MGSARNVAATRDVEPAKQIDGMVTGRVMEPNRAHGNIVDRPTLVGRVRALLAGYGAFTGHSARKASAVAKKWEIGGLERII